MKIKQLVSLSLCMLLFFGFACAKTPAASAQAPDAWKERMSAYTQKIAEQGYVVSEPEHKVCDDGATFDNYYISNSEMEEGSTYFIQTTEDTEYPYITVCGYNDDITALSLAHLGYLMQALVQTCDPSIAADDNTAKERVENAFREGQQSNEYVVAGVEFEGYMDNTAIFFFASNPSTETTDESEASFTTALDEAKTPFSFTQEEWVGWYNTSVKPYAVELKEEDPSAASDPALEGYLQQGDVKVYAIVHQLGITFGWILFSSSDDGLYQIRFVEREVDADFGLQTDLGYSVVEATDPDFRALTSADSKTELSDFYLDIVYGQGANQANGILYENSDNDDGITGRVSFTN